LTKELAETPQNTSEVDSHVQGEESAKQPGETGVSLKEINIRRLSDELAALINWRVKLVRMLLTREMNSDLFNELYFEYLKKAKELDRKRIELSKMISERIESLAFELQQLKLRCEAGEISAREYIEHKLKVDQEMWTLGPKLTMLQNPYKTTSLSVYGTYRTILDLVDNFEKEAPTLGVDTRTVNTVVKDLKRIHMVVSAESQE